MQPGLKEANPDIIVCHVLDELIVMIHMAEMEFSALARQCLNKRIDSLDKLRREVLAWADERNRQSVKVHWSFIVDTARDKLAIQYEKVNQANCKSKN